VRENFEEGTSGDVQILLKQGDRFNCICCGACCRNEFVDNWLQFVVNMGHDVKDDRCPFLLENDECSIYTKRFNPCRGFPFTLRKEKDGYRMAVFEKCPGFGKGAKIDQEAWIKKLVRLANREFEKGYRIDRFEETGGIVIVYLSK